MQANDYQEQAARTLIMEPDSAFTNEELAIMLAALELGAKVGKVLEYVKKGICHRHGFDAREIHRLLSEMAVADIELRVKSFRGGAHIPEHSISGRDQMLIWCALGLGGEAGEVMEIAGISSGAMAQGAIVKELGDCEWYTAALATLIGVPLSDVMQANIDKLKKRYKDGWNAADSKARIDVQTEKR